MIIIIYKNSKELGDYGEKIAIQFLKSEGYTIIGKNFFSKYGEIDIIAEDKNEYVFIEVKTRTNQLYGAPVESVDLNKQKHILKTSKYFIYKYNIQNEYIRFDVIEIVINKNGISINHIKNIFS